MFGLLFASSALAASTVPWHESLCLADGGYWQQRIAVTVSNRSAVAVAGKPFAVSLPALAGSQIEALRVCRSDGVELLFDVHDEQGTARRTGVLGAGDRLIVPIECGARGFATVFVYGANPEAWGVPDFLPAQTGGNEESLVASVGELERLQLTVGARPRLKTGPDWRNTAEIVVRNFGEQRVSSALVRVNLRTALACLPGILLHPAVRVASSDGTEVRSYALGDGADLLFEAELPARSEQFFQIGFRESARPTPSDRPKDYERLLLAGANLVNDGSFENGTGTPELWRKPEPGGPHGVTARLGEDARFGKRCLELVIQENSSGTWVGWNSSEIPVKPGALYLLSGWLKGIDLRGSAAIHAHFHDAKGALTRSGAMVGTQPSVGDSSDWVNSQGFFQAPPDAASVQLHLTMNTAGTLRHDGIVLCEVLDGRTTGVVQAGASKPDEPGLQVWEVNPLVKVFPDTVPQGRPHALAVELARNEYEPLQLAVRTSAGKPGSLEIAVSPLTNSGGAVLPPAKIERVGFVPIDYPSAYYSIEVPEWCRKVPRGAGATDGWAGWWPDPLAPGSNISLKPEQTQPIWFTVRAPKVAAPGNYQGHVTLRMAGEPPVTIPLAVRVLPFTLPDQTRLRAIFDLRFGPGGAFGSGANTREERRSWLRFLAEHRLGIDAINPSPKFSYQDGKVTMDAAEFDEEARLCFDELGMNAAYTPHFFYLFGWAYPPKKLFGLDPFTPEWVAAFKQAYGLFAAHVREKGWHDKFVYYISDEPHFQHPYVVEQMKQLCALIHEVDPGIPIYSSTWRHCPAWDDAIDLWGIGQYGCFPVAEMERLQGRGKQMWFTCDGQMATDTPYLATERMLPYYCYKYGVRGFEFWGMAWWTYDPWRLGWHQFIRQSDDGKRFYFVRYPDGDGYLAYPGKAVGVEGPVSTIRLEQIREGLEDYEAMALLTDLAQQRKQAGRSIPATERALQMAKALVSIPNAGGLRSTEILPDPNRIPAIRKAVNAALADLITDSRK